MMVELVLAGSGPAIIIPEEEHRSYDPYVNL